MRQSHPTTSCSRSARSRCMRCTAASCCWIPRRMQTTVGIHRWSTGCSPGITASPRGPCNGRTDPVNHDHDRLLEIEHLAKRYTSSGTLAIEDVTLDVRRSEFVSIVGPSGCGKTTLLKTVCGLLHPSSGSVRLDGRLVTTPPPEMVLVFQDYARSLFPWLTVEANIAFPLKHKMLGKGEERRGAAPAAPTV